MPKSLLGLPLIMACREEPPPHQPKLRAPGLYKFGIESELAEFETGAEVLEQLDTPKGDIGLEQPDTPRADIGLAPRELLRSRVAGLGEPRYHRLGQLARAPLGAIAMRRIGPRELKDARGACPADSGIELQVPLETRGYRFTETYADPYSAGNALAQGQIDLLVAWELFLARAAAHVNATQPERRVERLDALFPMAWFGHYTLDVAVAAEMTGREPPIRHLIHCLRGAVAELERAVHVHSYPELLVQTTQGETIEDEAVTLDLLSEVIRSTSFSFTQLECDSVLKLWDAETTRPPWGPSGQILRAVESCKQVVLKGIDGADYLAVLEGMIRLHREWMGFQLEPISWFLESNFGRGYLRLLNERSFDTRVRIFVVDDGGEKRFERELEKYETEYLDATKGTLSYWILREHLERYALGLPGCSQEDAKSPKLYDAAVYDFTDCLQHHKDTAELIHSRFEDEKKTNPWIKALAGLFEAIDSGDTRRIEGIGLRKIG
jgi:hypothetical protein